jgi:hypothetical protein
MAYMSSFSARDPFRKVCALFTATLILPALAFAGTDHSIGNSGQNNGNQNGQNKGTHPVAAVPEANAVGVGTLFRYSPAFFGATALP